jgi:drug/metabolite transporter (DMT)-like permease
LTDIPPARARARSRPGVDAALLLTMSAVWGSSFFWTKIALRSFAPATIVWARMGIAALALGVVLAATRTRLPRRPSVYARLAGLSVVNITIPFTMVTWGQQFTGSALASILSSTTPLFVFAIAVVAFSDERFTWPRLAGTVVAFAGIVLLLATTGQGRGHPASAAGALIVLASSAVFGCGNVLSRHVTREIKPLVAAFLQAAFGCVFEIPVMALLREPAFPPATGAALLAVLWLGVLGSALTYLLYFRLLGTLGSTRTSINTYLQPVVGVILGVVVLGEALPVRSVLAIAVILAGVGTFAAASLATPPAARGQRSGPAGQRPGPSSSAASPGVANPGCSRDGAPATRSRSRFQRCW